MKVYVVMVHSMFYDNDSYITKVFSSKEAAQAYVEWVPRDSEHEFEIDEWEVED